LSSVLKSFLTVEKRLVSCCNLAANSVILTESAVVTSVDAGVNSFVRGAGVSTTGSDAAALAASALTFFARGALTAASTTGADAAGVGAGVDAVVDAETDFDALTIFSVIYTI
jgi:hypothetical protein